VLVVLILLLVLLMVGSYPGWRAEPPAYGYYPFGGLGLLVFVLLILLVAGVL
jgi:hypothetical protein